MLKWNEIRNDRVGACNTSRARNGALKKFLGIMSSEEVERRIEKTENIKGFTCSGNNFIAIIENKKSFKNLA